MTLYLSGPMSGHTDWNYPAFNSAAMRLRGLGHDVLNPAENFGGDPSHPGGRAAYMRLDIAHVLKADGIAVMRDWWKSKGARLEVAVGLEIGLPVVYEDNLQPVPAEELSWARL